MASTYLRGERVESRHIYQALKELEIRQHRILDYVIDAYMFGAVHEDPFSEKITLRLKHIPTENFTEFSITRDLVEQISRQEGSVINGILRILYERLRDIEFPKDSVFDIQAEQTRMSEHLSRVALMQEARLNRISEYQDLTSSFQSNISQPAIRRSSQSRPVPRKPKKYILAPTIEAAKKAIKSMNFSKEPEILTAEQTKYIRDYDTVILVQGERFKKALKNITSEDLQTYYYIVKDMYYVKANKSARQSRSNEYLIKAKSYEAKYYHLKDKKGPTRSFLDFTGLKSIFS